MASVCRNPLCRVRHRSLVLCRQRIKVWCTGRQVHLRRQQRLTHPLCTWSHLRIDLAASRSISRPRSSSSSSAARPPTQPSPLHCLLLPVLLLLLMTPFPVAPPTLSQPNSRRRCSPRQRPPPCWLTTCARSSRAPKASRITTQSANCLLSLNGTSALGCAAPLEAARRPRCSCCKVRGFLHTDTSHAWRSVVYVWLAPMQHYSLWNGEAVTLVPDAVKLVVT